MNIEAEINNKKNELLSLVTQLEKLNILDNNELVYIKNKIEKVIDYYEPRVKVYSAGDVKLKFDGMDIQYLSKLTELQKEFQQESILIDFINTVNNYKIDLIKILEILSAFKKIRNSLKGEYITILEEKIYKKLYEILKFNKANISTLGLDEDDFKNLSNYLSNEITKIQSIFPNSHYSKEMDNSINNENFLDNFNLMIRYEDETKRNMKLFSCLIDKKNYSTLNENDGVDLRKPYIIDIEIDRILQSSDIFYITEEMVNEILEKNDPNFIRNIINYFYNKMSIKDQNRLFEKVLYNDKRFSPNYQAIEEILEKIGSNLSEENEIMLKNKLLEMTNDLYLYRIIMLLKDRLSVEEINKFSIHFVKNISSIIFRENIIDFINTFRNDLYDATKEEILSMIERIDNNFGNVIRELFYNKNMKL